MGEWACGGQGKASELPRRPITKRTNQYPPQQPAPHLLETATMRCALTIPAFRIFMCSPPPMASSNLHHSAGGGGNSGSRGSVRPLRRPAPRGSQPHLGWLHHPDAQAASPAPAPIPFSHLNSSVYLSGTSSSRRSSTGPRPWCAMLCSTSSERANCILPWSR